jgi:hypothetical protein
VSVAIVAVGVAAVIVVLAVPDLHIFEEFNFHCHTLATTLISYK